MIIKIRLPWPDSALNPNSRVHWSVQHRVKKRARNYAYITTKALLYDRFPLGNGDLRVKITFYPPDRRKRDSDNFIATQKAALDGVAEALGIDDSRFKLDRPEWGVCKKGGEVIIELESV